MDTQSSPLPKLTASELSSLWTCYMNNSMSQRIIGYFLRCVKDNDIHQIVQFSYDIAVSNVEKIISFFLSEEIPVPKGFTNEDVIVNAPRLYTDLFMLSYIQQMGKAGLMAYSGFNAMCARQDIRSFFSECLTKTVQLYNQTIDVSASKGLLVRSPYINYPEKIDQVDSQKYLNGFPLFSNKRPLNAIEIAYLHQNIQTNVLGAKLAISFAQISPRKEVQNFMLRGADISKKHVKIFSDILLKNDIQPPISSDVSITDSTTAPFSDKLTLFHMSFLSAVGIGNYATASAASQRTDLMLNYERLSVEIGQYAKDGANLMIKHEWLEQPPTTTDKHKLARDKGINS